MKRTIRQGLAAFFIAALLTGCGGGGGGGGEGVSNPPPTGGGSGGGGGGGGGGTQPTPANVAGTWNISETIDARQCGGSAAEADAYQVAVTQNGNSITVVAQSGTFTGVIVGNQVSWQGQYFDAEDQGYVTIRSLTLTVDGDSLSGSSSWDFRASQAGAVQCSGTTQITGQRVSTAGGGSPAAPTQLNAVAESATGMRLDWRDESANEQRFHVERRGGTSPDFSEIATVEPDVATFTDRSLTASTSYTYRVRASNSAGQSAYSNEASATTLTAAPTIPVAPTNLTLRAPLPTHIELTWMDVASNEDGYRILRSLDGASFAEVASIAANSRTYADVTGIVGSTQYHYRVAAYNAAGAAFATGTVTTPNPPPAVYTLNVLRAGAGQGSVTAAGINCGSDCSEAVTNGTTLTLTALAARGSALTGWTGCDSTQTTTCTLTVRANRVVTVTFGLVSNGITITLPGTSSTGNYTLAWTVSGLAQTPWAIQEAPNTSFANPTTYTSFDSASPFEYSFTNKPNGTYCYRISAADAWSTPACITVARSATAVLRIVNNSRYQIVDLRLNNQQQITYPYVIPAGGSADFPFTLSGTATSATVTVVGGVGFYGENGTRDVWFTYASGTQSLTAGNTTTVTLDPIPLGALLSGFAAARNWDGLYICYTCNRLDQYVRLRFTREGGWTFYRNQAAQGSGTVQLVSWPNNSPIVSFRLCSTCQTIQLVYPFGSFLHSNPGTDGAIVEYVAQ